jgi:hypothetical protein
MPVSAAIRDVYVSPGGDDGNAGTEGAPLRTLEAARTLARTKKQAGNGVTVYLLGGDYYLSSPLSLDADDSGIAYKGVSGQKVNLSGGFPVSGFYKVTDAAALAKIPQNARDKIYAADLSALSSIDSYNAIGGAAVTAFYELYIDGIKQTAARYPNTDYALTGTPADGRAFSFEQAKLEQWANAPNAVCGGYFGVEWYYENIAVSAVSAAGGVSLSNKPKYGLGVEERFFIFNLIEELDAEGEWFIDQNTKTLFCYSENGLTGKKAELAVSKNNILEINGGENITFTNINFINTRAIGASVTRSDGIKFYGCGFGGIGNTAVKITASRNCLLQTCEISGIGGEGAYIEGGDTVSLIPGNNRIDNCVISNFAQVFKTYCGGAELYGAGNSLTHSRVYGSPHMAVGISGNDHTVEYNEIFNAVTESTDAGAVYMGRDWTKRGTKIRYNYFHDIKAKTENLQSNAGVEAVYLDDMYSGTSVERNIFYNCSRAANIGGGRDNFFVNNIVINCARGVYYDSRASSNGGWANYHVIATGEVYKKFKALITNPLFDVELWRSRYQGFGELMDLIESYDADNSVNTGIPVGTVENNLFIGGNAGNSRYNVISSYIGGNRGFVMSFQDAGFKGAGDFGISAESAVYDYIPDWQDIPFGDIGNYSDEYNTGFSGQTVDFTVFISMLDETGRLAGIKNYKKSLVLSAEEEMEFPVDIPGEAKPGWTLNCFIWKDGETLLPLYREKIVLPE